MSEASIPGFDNNSKSESSSSDESESHPKTPKVNPIEEEYIYGKETPTESNSSGEDEEIVALPKLFEEDVVLTGRSFLNSPEQWDELIKKDKKVTIPVEPPILQNETSIPTMSNQLDTPPELTKQRPQIFADALKCPEVGAFTTGSDQEKIVFNPQHVNEHTQCIYISDEVEMPILGLGTRFLQKKDAARVIEDAVDAGFRRFDVSPIDESPITIIGETLRRLIITEKKFHPAQLFITTRILINNKTDPLTLEHHVHTFIKAMNVGIISLFVVQFEKVSESNMTFYDKSQLDALWYKLMSLYKEEYIEAIGVANFSLEQIMYIIRQPLFQIHNVQIEANLYWNQYKYLYFAFLKGIPLTAFAPLGSNKRQKSHMFNVGDVPDHLKNETVAAIAHKHHIKPVNVIILWQIQRGVTCTVGATKKKHMKQIMGSYGKAKLDADDMTALDDIGPQAQVYPAWNNPKLYVPGEINYAEIEKYVELLPEPLAEVVAKQASLIASMTADQVKAKEAVKVAQRKLRKEKASEPTFSDGRKKKRNTKKF